MEFISGASREQIVLFPEALDEYVTRENPVRFLDAFVDHLNLEESGFVRVRPGTTGRPAYDPRDLLKLYIYGYLNRIRSSRKLEQETHRNVEVMWLLRKLRPDHKTIADFRKDNRKAFKQVCRSFTVICRRLELFGNQLLAVDGSRFKAVNSPRRNFTKKSLKGKLKQIDEKIDAYLRDLDKADEQVTDEDQLTPEELQDRIQQLKQRKEIYGTLLHEMEQTNQKQISITDPDSRSTTKNRKVRVGYNAQIAVDEEHKLIVAQDVTNEINDTEQLFKVSLEAKNVLGVDHLKVVADSGYYNAQEIKSCLSENIEPYVTKRPTSSCASRGLFSKKQFKYNPDKDCYLCPAGEELSFRYAGAKRQTGSGARHIIRHYATTACKTCALKRQCTTNKNGRWIYRWEHEHLLENYGTACCLESAVDEKTQSDC